jgi:hypothetical protein
MHPAGCIVTGYITARAALSVSRLGFFELVNNRVQVIASPGLGLACVFNVLLHVQVQENRQNLFRDQNNFHFKRGW